MSRHLLASTAVVYLARGVEEDHLDRIERFVRSYRRYRPGIDHRLFVVAKGFGTNVAEAAALTAFESLRYELIRTDDMSFDLGAYAQATRLISQDQICYLNMNAEIASEDWLLKLAVNLALPQVGATAATGSYESQHGLSAKFLAFPNPHLRSNVFMLRRNDAIDYLSSISIRDKLDAYMLESGPCSMTHQMMARGMMPLVVGRNGRGYGMEWWPNSFTFRCGSQQNLLVHDNLTRAYQAAPAALRAELTRIAWADPDLPFNILAARS